MSVHFCRGAKTAIEFIRCMNCYRMSPKRMLERPFPVRKQSLHSSKKRESPNYLQNKVTRNWWHKITKKENKTWKKNESLLLDQGRRD